MTKPTRGRPPQDGPTPIRSIRVPSAEWSAWGKRAKALGKTISQWLRDLARAAITPQHKE